MKLRILFVSALFLFLAGAALAVPTISETTVPDEARLPGAWHLESVAAPSGYVLPATAPISTAQYFPVPCDDLTFPPSPRPFPVPWPFPSPWPGPTDQCIPNPFPF